MAARARVVQTIDALGYKADVPARLADVLSSTVSDIAARVLGRTPSRSNPPAPADDTRSV